MLIVLLLAPLAAIEGRHKQKKKDWKHENPKKK
jgi:hypothetical protein